LMVVFFIYASVVQLNDPDAPLWIAMYESGALSAAFASLALDMSFVPVFQALSACFASSRLCWHLYTFGFDFSPKTENGREAGGLSILSFWTCLTFLVSSTRKRTSRLFELGLLGVALAVVAGVYAVPKYYLSSSDVEGHCSGIGITPDQ
jgi:hypothetical protein